MLATLVDLLANLRSISPPGHVSMRPASAIARVRKMRFENREVILVDREARVLLTPRRNGLRFLGFRAGPRLAELP